MTPGGANAEESSAFDTQKLGDRTKAAFDFARESTKQLLTLATAILTVTITLATADTGKVPDEAKGFLGAMWIFYLVSIIFGLWTLLALTGTLQPKPPEHSQSSSDETEEVGLQNTSQPSIYGRNIQIPAILQVLFFLAGTIAAVVTGFVVL